eukprot:CAMPEP_0119413646 /NCGR_PEP_ID=MMETSP1335-20130426/5661_1 /TAXON_ID=259385 /ORGANISM="Chrysoculter rhomboideus, Strain RCC1486" /LENGTH=73 /DNA_ID=CAMNT_0007438449 /DNA_START=406 /DNA_END=624 /DNA_ORIENTATION=+
MAPSMAPSMAANGRPLRARRERPQLCCVSSIDSKMLCSSSQKESTCAQRHAPRATVAQWQHGTATRGAQCAGT